VSERTVKHDTIVVERNFKSSPERVFAAWADPNAHGLWKVPSDDWELADFENDFRVGGRERSCFGPKGDPSSPCLNPRISGRRARYIAGSRSVRDS
jgi:uncharacterized protein YndB with AHSA1/START domain